MHRRLRFALWCLPVLLAAGFAFAQGVQPGFPRNLVGPIAVIGAFSVSGASTLQSVSIGGGTAVTKLLRCTKTVDLANADNDVCTADEDITCTGATVGAECIVNAPTAASVAGSQFTCFVSATDTVKLRHCCNKDTSSCDPGSATYSVRVFNP